MSVFSILLVVSRLLFYDIVLKFSGLFSGNLGFRHSHPHWDLFSVLALFLNVD